MSLFFPFDVPFQAVSSVQVRLTQYVLCPALLLTTSLFLILKFSVWTSSSGQVGIREAKDDLVDNGGSLRRPWGIRGGEERSSFVVCVTSASFPHPGRNNGEFLSTIKLLI